MKKSKKKIAPKKARRSRMSIEDLAERLAILQVTLRRLEEILSSAANDRAASRPAGTTSDAPAEGDQSATPAMSDTSPTSPDHENSGGD